VIFVETPTFTRRVMELLDDDSYAELQRHIAHYPEAGKIIRGSGGIRKLRWAGGGRGKRGGLRVIYYWWVGKDQISMLFLYRKTEQEDLTREQLKLLRRVLEI